MPSPNDQPRPGAAGSPTPAPSSSSSRRLSHTNDSSSILGKRTAPRDDNNNEGNPPLRAKRRAPKACLSCRDRKVRCDVVSGGCPCTNCRLDGIECILKESNRGKNSSAAHQARAKAASSLTSDTSNRQQQPASFVAATTTTTTTTGGVGGETISGPGSGPASSTSTSAGHSQSHQRGDSGIHGGSGRGTGDEDDDERVPNNEEQHEQRHHQREKTPRPLSHSHSHSHSQSQTNTPPRFQPRGLRQPHRRHSRQRTLPTAAAPCAHPDNPPTSDYLVALAFEGQNDSAEVDAPPRHSARMEHVNGNGTGHAGAGSPPADQDRDDSRHGLPRYVRPWPAHLNEEDIEYLARKDCLTIPDDDLRDELIWIYVNVVYPFMPAIDLPDFLGTIIGSGSDKDGQGDGEETGKVSLLLFQAIMFASVTFIDARLLQSRGLESKRVARKVFFNRVKLLYSLDYEADRLTLVQSLLLMTYWYDSDSDDKHTWYWMGLALTTAQVDGLHRDADDSKPMTKMGRLRRRIWWSCVIRDRLLGLGIRRPSRIRDDEFSVSPLCLDDFDLEPPSPAVVRFLARPSSTDAADPSCRRAIAIICVDLSKLCMVIGRILHSQYTIASTPRGGSDYLRKAIVRPKNSKEQAHSFTQCDADLQEWLQNISSESRYTPKSREAGGQGAPAAGTAQAEGSMVKLHQTLLYMDYLTALGALHRPQVFYSGSDSIDLARKADSRRKVTEAAVAITKLAFDLQLHNQMCYSPTSSIPAFLSAALIHLLNTRSSDEETRNISVGRFCECLDALHQLQYMYAAADQAVQIVNNVLESAGLVAPFLGLSRNDRRGRGAGVGGLGGGMRGSRLMADFWPSRVATAYPSPAPAGNLDGREGTVGPMAGGATGGPTGGELTSGASGGVEGQFMHPQPAGHNLSPLPMLNAMDMWSVAGNMQPHPPDATMQGGGQVDMDAWYDVGDILDPALMSFELEPNFLTAHGMPM